MGHAGLRQPAPTYGHQAVVTNLTALLTSYVKTHDLGGVCVSPVDVVFDERRNLVLQPDVIFVSRDRLSILRDRVWGAPGPGDRSDLVQKPRLRPRREAAMVPAGTACAY